jgi:hypothetical protein
MGQREMGSPGHLKAIDSNAPVEGGSFCPLQGHCWEKACPSVPPKCPS